MATGTRTRMIEATVEALQRRGVTGMSFTEVLARSGAARGAIYHHFPGGKAQLVGEAAESNGRDVLAHLAALPGNSPEVVVESFLAAVRPVIDQSTRGGGCAVAAVTIDCDQESQALLTIAAIAFASWTRQLGDNLTNSGMDRDVAMDLAALLITLLEGAHVLCRAAGHLEPFDRAARAAINLTSSYSQAWER